jgi:hypothetical protein
MKIKAGRRKKIFAMYNQFRELPSVPQIRPQLKSAAKRIFDADHESGRSQAEKSAIHGKTA